VFIICVIILFIIYFLKNKKDSFTNKHSSKNDSLPKKIWMLWFQGWDNAPQLVKYVKKSWLLHNPTWEIIFLDNNNLTNYVKCKMPHNAKLAARSDIIRLYLMKHYGGVWVDASLVCSSPIETWIYDAIHPANYFMYTATINGPASWFMVFKPHHYVSTKWYNATIEFWKKNKDGYEYFWMDQLYKNLCNTDPSFFNMWKSVPYKYSEYKYGPHSIVIHNGVNILFDDYNKHHTFLNKLFQNMPFIIKLSHHNSDKLLKSNTVAYKILQNFLKKRKGIPFKPDLII